MCVEFPLRFSLKQRNASLCLRVLAEFSALREGLRWWFDSIHNLTETEQEQKEQSLIFPSNLVFGFLILENSSHVFGFYLIFGRTKKQLR